MTWLCPRETWQRTKKRYHSMHDVLDGSISTSIHQLNSSNSNHRIILFCETFTMKILLSTAVILSFTTPSLAFAPVSISSAAALSSKNSVAFSSSAHHICSANCPCGRRPHVCSPNFSCLKARVHVCSANCSCGQGRTTRYA